MDKIKIFLESFYETIYGTSKFEFCKFTSKKESSAFLEVVKNTYYHSHHLKYWAIDNNDINPLPFTTLVLFSSLYGCPI